MVIFKRTQITFENYFDKNSVAIFNYFSEHNTSERLQSTAYEFYIINFNFVTLYHFRVVSKPEFNLKNAVSFKRNFHKKLRF